MKLKDLLKIVREDQLMIIENEDSFLPVEKKEDLKVEFIKDNLEEEVIEIYTEKYTLLGGKYYLVIILKTPITHKYTVVVEDIECYGKVYDWVNFTREYVFYKTKKLSKEEQSLLIYDIDLEVDVMSSINDIWEVVSFKVYEEKVR